MALPVLGLLLLASLAWNSAVRRPAGETAPAPAGAFPYGFPPPEPSPVSTATPIPSAPSPSAPRAIALGPVLPRSASVTAVPVAPVVPLLQTAPAGPPPEGKALLFQLPATHLTDCGSCGIALYHAVSLFPGVLSINRFLGGDREVELLTDPALLDETRLLDLLSTTAFEPRSGDLTQDQPWMKSGPP